MNDPLNPFWTWGSLLLAGLMVLGYELRAWRLRLAQPEHQARFANARMRVQWAQAVAAQPGFEIVAVQALRNAMMSGTVAASTAALALMASLTLVGAALFRGLGEFNLHHHLALRVLLGAAIVGLLFAAYVCAALSTRYYGHASFIVSMPVHSAERQRLNPVCADYVLRAGWLYGWSLRLFLFVVPAVAGALHPLALVPAAAVLLVALHFMDQPGQLAID